MRRRESSSAHLNRAGLRVSFNAPARHAAGNRPAPRKVTLRPQLHFGPFWRHPLEFPGQESDIRSRKRIGADVQTLLLVDVLIFRAVDLHQLKHLCLWPRFLTRLVTMEIERLPTEQRHRTIV